MGSASAGAGGVKVVAVCGSPRKGKTTARALEAALLGAREAGADTELVELAGLRIDGSLAAGIATYPDQPDDFPAVMAKLSDPAVGGVLLGSPVYLCGVTALCKAFMDRCTEFWKTRGLRDKVGAALTVGGARNGGQETAARALHDWMLFLDMIVVGDGSSGAALGAMLVSAGDDVSGDAQGLLAARAIGKRVAEVAKRMRG